MPNSDTSSAVHQDSKKQSTYSPLSNAFMAIFLVSMIYWNFMHLWGASGVFWQKQWDKIMDTFGDDPSTYWKYGSTIVPFVTFFINVSFYSMLELVISPEVLNKFKIQPGTNQPVDYKKLPKVIFLVLINLIVVGFLASYIGHIVMEWRGYPPLRELPSFHKMFFDVLVFTLVQEILYYYTHLFFHHKLVYKYFHKQHHEWTSPIAITAIYAHPMEHAIVNILPLLVGPFIFSCHMVTFYFWLFVAISTSVNSHCGYNFPFGAATEFHDYHHQMFTKNYSTLGLMDYLHGTHSKNVGTSSFLKLKRLFEKLLL